MKTFRLIIAQTWTYMYKTAQVISEYLKPLYENNDFIIKNTQDFDQLIREQPPLDENEEYVSYDVESLYTNVHDAIKYILEEIYTHNKLPHICRKLILKRLLLKLATESGYIFQSHFYKQANGGAIGGPLSVTFVSYDVESLYTNVHDAIKYILEEIYTHNKLPHICRKLILKRLLLKLATESGYIFQSHFYKQANGGAIGGPLSVAFANIYLTKLKKDPRKPLKPRFYRRFVDDVISRRLKNTHNSLFDNLNNYHEKSKFTIETNQQKFVDARLLLKKDIIKFQDYSKANKFPVYWKSQIPKR